MPFIGAQHQRQQIHLPGSGIAAGVFIDVVGYAIFGDGIGNRLSPEVETSDRLKVQLLQQRTPVRLGPGTPGAKLIKPVRHRMVLAEDVSNCLLLRHLEFRLR